MKAVRIATWTLAGALSTATIGGIAYSASAESSATGTPAAAASTTPGSKAAGPAWLRQVEHGTFTARVKKQDKVFDLQRGLVTAVSPTSISVNSLDGFPGTYAVDSSTKIRKDGKLTAIGDVHKGDRVQVVGSGGKAVRIQDRHEDTSGKTVTSNG